MIEIAIDGMTCQHCVRHATEALQGLEGVTQVSVDLASGRAEVQVESPVNDAAIKEALDEEGYTATSIQRSQ
ncbi:MAG: cation-transporting ATPase [Candidatus Latescibacteria bacterium]|nr:cation-transporting ATPase [Candidatus Latescibacterota bacterium]